MSSGFPQNPQTWVPYEPTKDCSLGLCSIYCPQWCYVYFSPPPPSSFADSTSSPTLSPLVVVIIAIIAIAFILISYYTVFSKLCGVFSSLRRSLGSSGTTNGGLGQSHWHEDWHAIPSNGVDESLISKITVCKYKKGDGFVDSTDCSVCLAEFRDDESLRLLPNCSHAFHIQCIDTWLKSHSNCPLCRANIVPVNLSPPTTPQPLLMVPQEEASNTNAVIAVNDQNECTEGMTVTINESSHGSEQENQLQESSSVVEIGSANDDHNNIQQIRRSFSLDSSRRGRVSVADVLQMSMEDEIMTAKKDGFWAGTSSLGRYSRDFSKSGNRDRGLHTVMSPARMKRSMSNGRFFLTRHGRGKNTVLPV